MKQSSIMANVMLLGLDPNLQSLIDAFAKQTPRPDRADISSFLRMIPFAQWKTAAQALVTAGLPANEVEAGITSATQAKTSWIKDGLTLLSGGAAAFHGIKRNDSLLSGAWWFVMGVTFPITTQIVALAQGYGKPKKRC